MTNSEHLSTASEPESDREPVRSSRPRRRRSWMGRAIFWLLVLAVLSAFGLAIGVGDGQVNLDINGAPLNGAQAFVVVLTGLVLAAVGIALGVVLAMLAVAGVSILLLFIMVVVIGSLVLALAPVWLPVFLVVGVLLWLVRR